ncbi:MAG: MOSC domain-containing protein [Betaproteobacteria bacterium]
MPSHQILSINLGALQPMEVAGKLVETAMVKRPVKGAIEITKDGVSGDSIGDKARHGGDGQEVYLFSAEDLQWWTNTCGRTIPAGHLGENLTIDRWWSDVRIGDRMRAGALELEISFPRIPCATLATHMGGPQFLKTFIAARRPGFYARVISAAPVCAGQELELLRAGGNAPLAIDLFDLWHNSALRRKELLLRASAAPIAQRARKSIDNWLAAPANEGS